MLIMRKYTIYKNSCETLLRYSHEHFCITAGRGKPDFSETREVLTKGAREMETDQKAKKDPPLFPAEVVGNPKYISIVASPYKEVKPWIKYSKYRKAVKYNLLT